MAVSADGEIAAYYGVFPIIGLKNNAPTLMAQSGATMTHPNHQKRGLFVELAKMTFEAAKQEGVSMIYGFPNENSLPGFQTKLNWNFQSTLKKVIIKTGEIPFCELASKSKIVKRVYRFILNRRISKLRVNPVDICFSSTSVHHSKLFLEYKLRNPDVLLVSLDGIDFLVKSSPHLLIGDVKSDLDMSPKKLREALIKLGRKFLAAKVVLQFTSNHWLAEMFESTEMQSSLPVGYLTLDKSEMEMEFNYSDLDTF
jgi:hypothetical protein